MHAEAVGVLRAAYIAGAVLDAGAFVGMVLPDRFGAYLRYLAPFDPARPEFGYGMRSGAPLMAGWTILLLWALSAPVARRDVLVITAVPVVVGLMLNDAVAKRRGYLRSGPVWATRAAQVLLLTLFAVAYLAS